MVIQNDGSDEPPFLYGNMHFVKNKFPFTNIVYCDTI